MRVDRIRAGRRCRGRAERGRSHEPPTGEGVPVRAGAEGGFSILEVVIAITILMTVLVSVGSLLQTEFKVGANSRYEQEATQIASATLDTELAQGASTLLAEPGDTALSSVTSGGQTYVLEMEVAPYDPGTLGCVAPTSDSNAMLKVTIWATWADVTSGSTWWVSSSSAATGLLVQESSLVAVPASALNSSDGSILVSVQNAAGSGVQHLSVTATPSSGTALTAVTTENGCVLFSNVSASVTWKITFVNLSGYLTEQESTLPSTLAAATSYNVTADATTSVSYTPTASPANGYDQAATVTPIYTAPVADGVHPIVPSNISAMPLSFYSTTLTTSPYVTTSPAQVFPIASTPSYYMVPGSCGSESDPDGSTTDGTAVSLTSGGTTTPSVSLLPVQIFVSQGGTYESNATVTAQVSNAAGTGSDTNCPSSGSTVMPTLQLGSTTATWTSVVRRKGHKHLVPGGVLVSNCSSNCSTVTTVTSNTNPVPLGQSVTLTATVTCSPTACAASPGTPSAGTVQFKVNGSNVGSAQSVNGSGVATLSTSSFSFGSNSVTAVYSGSGTKWKTSTSSAYTETATSATTTTVTPSPNPNSYGLSTTITATVTCSASGCGTPTGTVTFTNNGTSITGCVGTALSSGSASCTLSGVNGGTYGLAATYTPTTNYQASSSVSVSEQINPATTTTVLTSSAGPNAAAGTSITFTATVTAASGGPAVGSVAFKDGATLLATVALNSSGVATYSTSTLTIGTHSMSAVFTATNGSNFSTSTGTFSQGISVAYTLVGLPYGVWLLSATWYNSSNGHTYSTSGGTPVVLTVSHSGFKINGGTLQAAGGSVTLQVQ